MDSVRTLIHPNHCGARVHGWTLLCRCLPAAEFIFVASDGQPLTAFPNRREGLKSFPRQPCAPRGYRTFVSCRGEKISMARRIDEQRRICLQYLMQGNNKVPKNVGWRKREVELGQFKDLECFMECGGPMLIKDAMSVQLPYVTNG